MRAALILALCVAAVAAVPSNPQRIVGGSVTNIASYPTIAALLYSQNLVSYFQSCGGSIINQRSILTAAHCTIGDAANRWRVRLGSTYANSLGVVHYCAQIINHRSYNARTMDNDVAIVKTNRNIVFMSLIQAASFAGTNYNLGNNEAVWAAGWGTTSSGGPSSEQLRHVQIWTVDQNTCAQSYATVGSTITANMLCSGWLENGGRDQCQGDSGGPLYHNNIVVGVCSFGQGCAQARFPGVNARVSRFTTWIQENA